MIVKVTAGHVAAGVKEKCLECPVALAVAEALGVPAKWEFLSVMSSRIRLGPPSSSDPDHRDVYQGNIASDNARDLVSGPEVWVRIARFDVTGRMDPFEFEIPDEKIPPSWLERLRKTSVN